MFNNTEPRIDQNTGTPTSDWHGLRGDTLRFGVVNNTDNSWAGAAWVAQVRVKTTDDDPLASFTVDTTDPDSVLFILQTDGIAVGDYVYDVQWSLNGYTDTFVRGALVIKNDVSRIA